MRRSGPMGYQGNRKLQIFAFAMLLFAVEGRSQAFYGWNSVAGETVIALPLQSKILTK